MAQPKQSPPTVRPWKKPYLAALLLCAMGPIGLVVTEQLTRAAWNRMQDACETDPSTPYTKGFPFILPAGALAAAILGMILLVIVLAVGGRKPVWSWAVAVCIVVVALLSASWLGLIVDGYHEYPGSGPASLSGSPCPYG